MFRSNFLIKKLDSSHSSKKTFYFGAVIFAISSLILGLWFYWEKTQDTVRSELNHLGAKVNSENKNIESVVADLKKLKITKDNIPEASYLVMKLVVTDSNKKEDEVWKKTFKEFSDINAFFPTLKTRLERHNLWGFKNRATYSMGMRYIIDLARMNFGNTRNVLNYFASLSDSLPYFDLLVIQAGYEISKFQLPIVHSPGSLSAKTKQQIQTLFTGGQLIDWAKHRKINLQHYSGMTNTILGVYDWISYPLFSKEVGFQDFPSAAVYFDLGGGFATPDISRLIGKNFISLDILSPREARDWQLSFQVLKSWRLPDMAIDETRMQDESERKIYYDKLDNQKWLSWDVYENPIPVEYNSYFITSFGFLSSTILSLSKNPLNKVEKLEPYYSITYMAIRRVIELVALGKTVTLFTYKRTRARQYKYKTILLSFKDHSLVAEKFFLRSESKLLSEVLERSVSEN